MSANCRAVEIDGWVGVGEHSFNWNSHYRLWPHVHPSAVVVEEEE